MIADLPLTAVAATGAPPLTTTLDDYAQRHPLQIAVCLRGLATRQDFIAVEFDGRQLVTQIIEVDSRNARFVFDLGSVDTDNRALPRARELKFHGTPSGIRTEFTTSAATPIIFDGRPAFEATFPAVLYYVQRREYFRVETPLLDPFTATGTRPGDAPFKLVVKDLSLGGVALRATDSRFDDVATGHILHDVILKLGSFGTLQLDLEIVAPRRSMTPGGELHTVLGCRFLGLPGAAERTLQRVITQLETKRLALSPRS
ncbi:flagellar brake protein [Burkholderia sp. Ac-20365]|uniref:flagellar brake protein n=1 Tax=Burkholderia sp. Ac-20365 TaxID=2703897 RepID=UPI00197C2B5F|nr:flagellar brake protein [Burkholderia sp. Ac-20365]MBN3759387.1 flagellar brake protein [Burkholderia sp. Ac-20365]